MQGNSAMLLAIYLGLLGLGLLAAILLATQRGRAWRRPWTPLLLTTIATGVICYSGAGVLALQFFALSPEGSQIAALVFALLGVTLFEALVLAGGRIADRQLALVDLVGAVAVVVVPIAPDQAGAVVLRHRQPRITLTATSQSGSALAVGDEVVVTACNGQSVAVALLDLPREFLLY